MSNRQIVREQWPDFLETFSRRHEGWLVSTRVLSPGGWQVESRNLALQGIASDRRGTSVSIHLGRTPGPHVGHVVTRPHDIWVEEEEDGGERGLEIESDDGTKWLLEFRSAPLPDAVDGLLAADERPV
jgi:hypothetical protein